MKKRNLLLLLVFVALVTTIVSLTVTQTVVGPHGGHVNTVEEYKVETQITPEHVYAYLLNSKDKPVSNKGVSCEIKFFYYDRGSLDLHLTPYKEDGFIADAEVAGYHSYRVTFHVFGKSVSTIFSNENEDIIVKRP